jgi:GxxExxY protein
MPIIPARPVTRLKEKDFHKLDYQIMKTAFDAHNQLGRFYDEKICQNALLKSCEATGLRADTEFEIKLTHRNFSKSFFIDLLFEGSTVSELKAVKAIQEASRIQILDYLFMSDTRLGKLINFRPPSVEHEFVSTSLSNQDRHAFSIETAKWKEPTDTAVKIKTLITELLNDWGAFLNTTTYKEALCFFLGGDNALIKPIEIRNNGNSLGHQNIPVVNNTETFCLTSLTKDIPTYKAHLSRFMSHTRLHFMYWINFNRFKIQFTPLENKLFCP